MRLRGSTGVCPTCGAVTDMRFRFCGRCGARHGTGTSPRGGPAADGARVPRRRLSDRVGLLRTAAAIGALAMVAVVVVQHSSSDPRGAVGDPGRAGQTAVALDGLPSVARWETDIEGAPAQQVTPAPPAVAEGVAVVVGHGVVTGLDLRSGQVVWRAELPVDAAAQPVIAAGLAVIAADRALYALAPSTGHLAWEREVRDLLPQEAALVVHEGRAVVAAVTGLGRIVGVDAETGEQLWELRGLDTAVEDTPSFERIESVDDGRYIVSARGRRSGTQYRYAISASGGRVEAVAPQDSDAAPLRLSRRTGLVGARIRLVDASGRCVIDRLTADVCGAPAGSVAELALLDHDLAGQRTLVTAPAELDDGAQVLGRVGDVVVAQLGPTRVVVDVASGTVLDRLHDPLTALAPGAVNGAGDELVVPVRVDGGDVAVLGIDLQSGQRAWLQAGFVMPVGVSASAFGALVADVDGSVVAVSDGSEAWRVQVVDRVGCAATTDPHTVYLNSDGAIRAIDARTGGNRWTLAQDLWFLGPPHVGQNGLHIVDRVGRVYTVEAASGVRQHVGVVGGDPLGPPTADEQSIYAAGGSFSLGGRQLSGYIRAVDARTGGAGWIAYVGGILETPPSAAEGGVYGVIDTGQVVALDPASGDIRWTSQPLGRPTSPAGVSDDRIAVASSGRLRLLATSDGHTVSEVEFALPLHRVPAIGTHVVVRESTTSVAAFGRDGALDWSSDLDLVLTTPPVIAGRHVVVGTVAGVAILDLGDGSHVRTVPLTAPVTGIAGATEDGLAVCTSGGRLALLGQ